MFKHVSVYLHNHSNMSLKINKIKYLLICLQILCVLYKIEQQMLLLKHGNRLHNELK